jgi:hypothetical protein
MVDYKQIEAVKKAAEERARQLMGESVISLLPKLEEIEAWAKEQSIMEPTGAEEFGRKYGALWMRDLIEQYLKNEQHLKNDLKFVTPMYEITISDGKTFTSANFEELKKYTDGLEGMLEYKLMKKTKKK